MRKSSLALLAAMALLVGACGASGDGGAADQTTSTSEPSSTTVDGSTDADADDTTTTTEDVGGDLVGVDDWAEGFCGSFESWLEGITASGEGLQDSIAPGDLDGAKVAIVGLFGDVADQTRELIDEIEVIGAPDIDDGEEFLADLLGRFEAFHAAIEAALSDAEAVSTTDPASFQATITELLATFQTETEAVGNSFAELDAQYGNAELDAAVTSACSFM